MDTQFSGEPLPTLEESLDLAKGRIGVYIEIKNSGNDAELERRLIALAAEGEALIPAHRDEMIALIEGSGTRNLELTRKSIEAVRARRMKRQIVIQSFSPTVCAIALAEAPELRTELLGSTSRNDPNIWKNHLLWAKLLDVPGFNVNRAAMDERLLDTFHRAGKSMAVWTVNDAEEMARLARMGVDAIITNRPDSCLEVLKGLE